MILKVQLLQGFDLTLTTQANRKGMPANANRTLLAFQLPGPGRMAGVDWLAIGVLNPNGPLIVCQ